MRYEWKSTPEEAKLSLLAFLQKRLSGKDYSMRKIKGWIDAGYCFVKGRQERFSRTPVGANSKVELRVPIQEKRAIAFLHEDEALLVLDKPAGISCDERLEEQLASLKKPALLVHRLDKETTGVLLCAKSQAIKDYFITEFRDHAVQKRYVAIVDGSFKEESGAIENYIGPVSRAEGRVKWGKVEQGGHYAETLWRVLKKAKSATLVELEPKTGRTHQLRVHMSQMGHSILGDHTYAKGYRCSYRAPRVMLHAESLSFVHPLTKKPVTFSSPLPDDFTACLKELF